MKGIKLIITNDSDYIAPGVITIDDFMMSALCDWLEREGINLDDFVDHGDLEDD